MRSWAQALDFGLALAQVYIATKLVGELVISITWVRFFPESTRPLAVSGTSMI